MQVWALFKNPQVNLIHLRLERRILKLGSDWPRIVFDCDDKVKRHVR